MAKWKHILIGSSSENTIHMRDDERTIFCIKQDDNIDNEVKDENINNEVKGPDTPHAIWQRDAIF